MAKEECSQTWGSLLRGRWEGRGDRRLPKTAPRPPKTTRDCSKRPQDHPKRPQDRPKRPPSAPKRPQEGAQTAPNPPIWPRNAPRWPQETSFFSNRIFPICYLCSRTSICLHLRKDSTKLSRSYQEASKKFANRHIIISELLSLLVSELPVSSCLGGIREAQTIIVCGIRI